MEKRIIRFEGFYQQRHRETFLYKVIMERYGDFLIESDDHKNPDYVVHNALGAQFITHNGIRIYYTEENDIPNFNQYDYAIGFARMGFEDRYLRFPLYAGYDHFGRAQRKHIDFDGTRKEKFCNMVVSNLVNADPMRMALFERLNAYKPVDSGGIIRNNVGGRVADKIAFATDYRFSIASENSSATGYITEKIIDAWAAGTIPIYWGDPQIVQDFNEKAFLNVHAFGILDELVQRIDEIENDPELYREIMRQPIVTPGCLAEQYTAESLGRFLDNIFLQSPAKARRICQYGRSKYLLDNEKHFSQYEAGAAYRARALVARTVRHLKGEGIKEVTGHVRRLFRDRSY